MSYRRLKLRIGLCCAMLGGAAHAGGALRFADVFQDHAVLQRDRPITVWGDAGAGDVISVSLATRTASAVADGGGHWRVQLPGLPAGGPYVLSANVQGGTAQTSSDVLLGDVWLCSGQSNMEFPVSKALNSDREIAASANGSIRLLSVSRAASAAPLSRFQDPVAWSIAGPDTVGPFSAACYFFARELQRSVPVPMGLIHASYGGSRIEPWMSTAALADHRGFESGIDMLRIYARDPVAGNVKFGESWERWWQQRAPASTPWKAGDAGDWQPVPEPMRDWKTWGVAELAKHDGMVWFRRSVTLTAAQAMHSAKLSIGAIDEVDETFVNGRAIAHSFGWGTERTYPLPAGVLRAGENLIVINVLSTWDAGGMYGPPEHLALHFADDGDVPLAGQWHYQFVPERFGYPPRAPWETVSGLSILYNAMIAPLGALGLRGALWYQGESNTGEADHYQSLLTDLMADWRRQFGADLPYLIVELPNFGSPAAVAGPFQWAQLREAQRRAVAGDNHAALAVAIDVGEASELHPPNKQAVGARLARAARHLIYGHPISPSGPRVETAHVADKTVVVTFADVDGRLLAYSGPRPIGFELCGATQQTCRLTDAVVAGQEVRMDLPDRPVTRVRFCWGDAPVCNLYDESGLPVGPFEIAVDGT